MSATIGHAARGSVPSYAAILQRIRDNMIHKHLSILFFVLISIALAGAPVFAQTEPGNGDVGNGGDQEEEQPEEQPSPQLPETEEPPEGEEEGFIEPYGLGSQHFTIELGLFRPLFFHFPGASEVEKLSTFESALTQLSLGGTGSLAWGSYLTNRFSLGMELAGTFSFSPNGYIHSLIPITMRMEYLFRKGSFEFPVHLNTGVVFNSFRDQLYFGPIVIPGITGYYNLNAEWGLGLSLDYWWVPEIYFGDKANRSGFGNMLDLSFSARYHFS